MTPFRIACPLCKKRLTISKPELVGKRVKCPQCKNPLVLTPPPEKKPPTVPDSPPESVEPTITEPEPILPQLDIPEDDVLAKARRRRKQRKSGGGAKWVVISLFSLLSLGAIGGYVYVTTDKTAPQPVIPTSRSPQTPPAKSEGNSQTKSAPGMAKIERGEPYTFDYVPTGARLVFHWRPASLRNSDELWQCSGELLPWLDEQLVKFTGIDSQNLDQAVCYLIPGPRGTPPLFVFKIQPLEAFNLQEWTNTQTASPERVGGYQLYELGEQRILWLDERNGLSVHQSLVEEAVSTETNPLPMTAALDQLITLSDRDAEFSLLFDLKSIELGLIDWFEEDKQAVIKPFLGWWGKETEAVLWELKMDNNQIHSRMEIQATPFISTSKLEQHWKTNFDQLGKFTWEDLRDRALHSVGAQTILARFPAMLQLASRFTAVQVDRKRVTVQTTLSERAAPNLSLASWLYWRERMLPESFLASSPAVATANGPKTVAERLQSTLFVDFRLTPLQEAIEQIGGEIQVSFQIDGDALKNEGYTQNMQQNYNLGEVTAETTLKHLLEQYPKMVLVLKENENQAVITTQAAAEAQQLVPYTFPVEKPSAEKP
ncbi:MAG: hypothetical protein KDA65_02435 [Planctomycetaceae bacterium]|nr:hypothetical protein [Planctomycetaceae bacterium]